MTGILRFISVGGLATLTHYFAALMMAHLFRFHPEVANVCGFVIAFTVSFLGHWRWTFRDQQARFHRALPAFALVAAIMFLLNALILHLLLKYAPFRFELALLLAQSMVVVLTYVASKYWAFARPLDSLSLTSRSS